MKAPFKLPARLEDGRFLVAHDCEQVADLYDAFPPERDYILKAVNHYPKLLDALAAARNLLDQQGCELHVMDELDTVIREAT